MDASALPEDRERRINQCVAELMKLEFHQKGYDLVFRKHLFSWSRNAFFAAAECLQRLRADPTQTSFPLLHEICRHWCLRANEIPLQYPILARSFLYEGNSTSIPQGVLECALFPLTKRDLSRRKRNDITKKEVKCLTLVLLANCISNTFPILRRTISSYHMAKRLRTKNFQPPYACQIEQAFCQRLLNFSSVWKWSQKDMGIRKIRTFRRYLQRCAQRMKPVPAPTKVCVSLTNSANHIAWKTSLRTSEVFCAYEQVGTERHFYQPHEDGFFYRPRHTLVDHEVREVYTFIEPWPLHRSFPCDFLQSYLATIL